MNVFVPAMDWSPVVRTTPSLSPVSFHTSHVHPEASNEVQTKEISSVVEEAAIVPAISARVAFVLGKGLASLTTTLPPVTVATTRLPMMISVPSGVVASHASVPTRPRAGVDVTVHVNPRWPAAVSALSAQETATDVAEVDVPLLN